MVAGGTNWVFGCVFVFPFDLASFSVDFFCLFWGPEPFAYLVYLGVHLANSGPP